MKIHIEIEPNDVAEIETFLPQPNSGLSFYAALMGGLSFINNKIDRELSSSINGARYELQARLYERLEKLFKEKQHDKETSYVA